MNTVKALARAIVAKAISFYRAYPARSNSYIAAAVVAAAGLLGFGLDVDTVLGVVAIVVPILAGGEATHRKVTPAP